ncbi:MAG: NAD(P)-dependent oxidoreductase [Candidatus Pacearchaeota archaeon]
MADKKKILVTGGLGHIGSQLIREYSKREDIEIIRIFDNLKTQRYCSLFNLPENGKFEFFEGDILNTEDLDKAMKDIDIVIHLAAITDAPSTIEKPQLTMKVNFIGTKNVLEAAEKANVKKFLFPSTTSVYGETSGLVDENFSDLKPCTPYAEAKLASENLVREYGKSGKLNTTILRMGTIYGPSMGMRFHTAVNKFTWLAAMNKPLTVWDNAFEQKRPYLGLTDAIRAYQFLEEKGESGELYNVLTDNYTVREVVEAIKKSVPDIKIEITKAPIINQKSYEVSNEKIKALGFTFQDDLADNIKKKIEMLKGVKN